MRNKRIIGVFIVIVLLAVLSSSVYASSDLHPAAPTIVGVWNTTIKIDALPQSFGGLWSFSGDGNFLDINAYKETNPGVWIGSGNTYVLTFWGFFVDEQGQNYGRARIRLLIKMDGNDHFTADGQTDSFDTEGKPMESEFDGSVHLEGERMQVELPDTVSAPQ